MDWIGLDRVYIAAPEPIYVGYLLWKYFDVIWTYHCRVLRSVGVGGISVVLLLLIKVMYMHVVPLSITVGEVGIVVHVCVEVVIRLVCTRNCGWPAY